MAIERSLYEAPKGISALAADEEPLDIVLPEDEEAGEPAGHDEEAENEEFNKNLAEDLPETVLQTLSSELVGFYDQDLIDRKEWLDTYVEGLKRLGLKYEERMKPWKGACGVTHPLLMESAVKFQSEMIMETFPPAGPVRTKIIGKETPEKKQSAKRVEEDMNYELTEVMSEYRPEHERMLISLCLSGNAFKKIYFDPALQRQTAVFVSAEDIVVPYGASNLESAERVTHRMRKTKNEVRRLQVAGFYRDIEMGDPVLVMDEVDKQKAKGQGFSATQDNRYQLLEMNVLLDLEGYEDKDEKGNLTGIEIPYIVTIDKGTGTVLAIRRNYLEEDPTKTKRQHYVHYGYVPGFGFYYFGLIHLIGGHARSATSLLRQLIDSGTLSNLPGGLKSKGMRIKGDDTPIAPGEWRDVDLPGGTVRDNILPLPYKEPSLALSALMDKVIEDGRRFAGVADLKLSDMSAQAPVGTTLAVLERVLKVMSAVQARIHFTMKQEFKLLSAIIRDNTPVSYDYEPEVGAKSAKQGDYDTVEVIPVSDPNASTMSQRVVQYQAVLQLSQTAPQIYDLPFLHRQMIETLGVKNVAKIVPMADDMVPVDPVSENMNVLMGKPVKAFMGQDHEAHLAVHMAALQDPKMMAMVGQNPQAQAIQGAAMAHVMEHVAWQYRREIEKQLGAALPPMPEADGTNALPPAMEAQLSQLVAQAAAKLLQKDVAEAQAQAAQQAAEDPLVALQKADLEIKGKDLERKRQKDIMDAAAKADAQATHDKEVDGRLKLDALRLAKDAAATEDTAANAEAMAKQQLHTSHVQTSADFLKHHSTQAHDMAKHEKTLASQQQQKTLSLPKKDKKK